MRSRAGAFAGGRSCSTCLSWPQSRRHFGKGECTMRAEGNHPGGFGSRRASSLETRMSRLMRYRNMPEQKTLRRAQNAKRQGKAPTTQAGEFVREEIEHVREGKHGARNTKQAIAIGLSKARRAGVKLKPPRRGETSERTRKSAERAYRAGQSAKRKERSARRSRAAARALKREPKRAASRTALSRQARSAAARRRRSAS